MTHNNNNSSSSVGGGGGGRVKALYRGGGRSGVGVSARRFGRVQC